MTQDPKQPKPARSPLLVSTSILTVIGLIFISISTLSEASNTIGDKFYFIKKQLIWLVLGIILYHFFSRIKLTLIKKYTPIVYYLSLIFLSLVLIPKIGNSALGARRWLDLGFISLQPSEFLKFTSVLFFSNLFVAVDKLTLKNLMIYLGIPFLLIVLEPNLSTAILTSAIVISIYYLAGGEIFSLFKLMIVCISITFALILASPYRQARFNTLIHPEEKETTSSYHRNQIILTLSSGGIFGKGFANSDQKYRYLPKVSTDSILAVIGEETGFVGILIIFYLYITLINHLFRLSQVLTDKFSSYLTAGIASWIAYQCLINLAAIAALIPLTGVPLPFISYGGSSLICLLSAIGLIRNIENHNPNLVYSNNDASNQNHRHNRITPHASNRINKTTSNR
jgi:cell division protein FtsW